MHAAGGRFPLGERSRATSHDARTPVHSALGAPLTPRGIVCVRHRTGELWSAKQKMDPKGVLGNTLIDTLLLPDGALVESHHRLLASFDAAKKASAAEKKQGWFKARGWF